MKHNFNHRDTEFFTEVTEFYKKNGEALCFSREHRVHTRKNI